MNIRHTKHHLSEAMEQLQETLDAINSSEFSESQLQIDLEHLYHHLNTAWNARNASEEETKECSDENYNKWGEFPTDLELLNVNT